MQRKQLQMVLRLQPMQRKQLQMVLRLQPMQRKQLPMQRKQLQMVLRLQPMQRKHPQMLLQTTADGAQTAADAAQTTADGAQTAAACSANNCRWCANNCRCSANNWRWCSDGADAAQTDGAQTAADAQKLDGADAAQTTADGAQTAADAAQAEIDAIETSMGAMVNSSGVYQQFSGTNYIDGNADLTQDLIDLDAAIASVSGGSGITAVVDDPNPQLGGDLVVGSRELRFSSGGVVNLIDIDYDNPTDTFNSVCLSSVKSMHFFLDANGGDSGQYFGFYNNLDPHSGVVNKSSAIFTISEDGTATADSFEGHLVGDLNGPICFEVINNTPNTIEKGRAIYISGISGNTPEVGLADASSPATMPAFGLAFEDIPPSNTGKVTTFGSLQGLDAGDLMEPGGGSGSAPGLGATLYISSTNPGTLTATPPSGESNLIQNIGKAERVTPSSNMTVKVGGAGRSNATPALDDGNIFIGDASNNSVTASLQDKIIENLNAGNIVVDDQRVNLPEAPNNTVEYIGWNRADADIISASVYCDTVNTNGSLTLNLINLNAVGAPSCFSTPYNMNGLSPQTVTTIPLSGTPSDLQFSAGDPWRLEISSNDPAMNAQGIYVMLSFKRSL